MRRSLSAAVGLASALAFALPASAGEDYFSTDFMYRLQNEPGFFSFYDFTNAVLGNGVTGNSSQQKFGFLASLPRVDFFYVGTKNEVDLKRTNRYGFNIPGTSLGFRVHLLNEKDGDPLGLAIGYQNESYYPSSIFRNGFDLKIVSPDESSNYGFLLATKKVTDDLRLNAGVKLGTANVGPTTGYSRSYSAGMEYQITDEFSIQGNYKLIQLQGVPTNNNLSLRFNYEPNDILRLQLHTDYYSAGIAGQFPSLYPIAPGDLLDRFGTKPQLTYGMQLGLRFGESTPSAAEVKKQQEEEWENSLPSPSPEPGTQPPAAPTPVPAATPSGWQPPPVNAPPVTTSSAYASPLTSPNIPTARPAVVTQPAPLPVRNAEPVVAQAPPRAVYQPPPPSRPVAAPTPRPTPLPRASQSSSDDDWDNFEAPSRSNSEAKDDW